MEAIESRELWNSCCSKCIKSLLCNHANLQSQIQKLGLSDTFEIAWPEPAIKGVTEFVLAFDAATRTAWFRDRKLELTKEILRDAFQLPHVEFSKYLQRWRDREYHDMFDDQRSPGNPYSINGLKPPYDEWKEVIRLVQKVLLGNGRPTLVTGKVMRYFYAYFVCTLPGRDRQKKQVKMPDWADLVLDELTSEMKRLKKHLTRPVERHSSYCGTAITHLLIFWGYTWGSLNGDGAVCSPVDIGTINIRSFTAAGVRPAKATDLVANDGGEGHWSAGGADESAGEDLTAAEARGHAGAPTVGNDAGEEKKKQDALLDRVCQLEADREEALQARNAQQDRVCELEADREEALQERKALQDRITVLEAEKKKQEEYHRQMCANVELVGEQLAMVITDGEVQIESLVKIAAVLNRLLQQKSASMKLLENKWKKIAVVLSRLLYEKSTSYISLKEDWNQCLHDKVRYALAWVLDDEERKRFEEQSVDTTQSVNTKRPQLPVFWPFNLDVDACLSVVMEAVRKGLQQRGLINPNQDPGFVNPGTQGADGNVAPVRIEESMGSQLTSAEGDSVPMPADQLIQDLTGSHLTSAEGDAEPIEPDPLIKDSTGSHLTSAEGASVPIEPDPLNGTRKRMADGNAVPVRRKRLCKVTESTEGDIQEGGSVKYYWLNVKPEPKTLIDDSELTSKVDFPAHMLTKVDTLEHQQKGVAWMCGRECKTADPRGGILSDDQGMGKTLQSTVLMLTHRDPTKPTLLCCPKAVVMQWALELQDKVNMAYRFKVGVYSEEKVRDADWMRAQEIVITTYASVRCAMRKAVGTPGRPFRKKTTDTDVWPPEEMSGPFENVEWGRIILDECHNIKNKNSDTAIALCRLRADFRWCLSGTPVSNKVEEVFSYFTFLRYTPLNTERKQKRHTATLKGKTEAQKHMALHTHMVDCTLRRMKDRLKELKEKKYHHVRVGYNPSSKDEELYKKLTVKLTDLAKERSKENAQKIFILMLRLRQVCVHRNLATPHLASPSVEKRDLAQKLLFWEKSTHAASECERCKEEFDESNPPQCVIPCQHYFCGDCAGELELVQERIKCPKCRKKFNKDRVVYLENAATLQLQDLGPEDFDLLGYEDDSNVPQKFIVIIERLKEIIGKSEKTIIFSQWPAVFPMLRLALYHAGIGVQIIHGEMQAPERQRNLEEFKTKPEVPVMLLSLTACGAGLNIIEANHVMFLDQCWNPATEDQAVDRVHRIGQKKEVHVYHFLVEGTVERRIIRGQCFKRTMARQVLHGNNSKVGKSETQEKFWRSIWEDHQWRDSDRSDSDSEHGP